MALIEMPHCGMCKGSASKISGPPDEKGNISYQWTCYYSLPFKTFTEDYLLSKFPDVPEWCSLRPR